MPGQVAARGRDAEAESGSGRSVINKERLERRGRLRTAPKIMKGLLYEVENDEGIILM